MSEPALEAGGKSFHTLCTSVEVSGVLQGLTDTYLIVCANRALPFGTRIRFRWQGESHSGLVEDTITDGDRFLIWIQVPGNLALEPSA